MSCVQVDFPELPSLGPISLAPPALPAVDISADFCCKFQLIDFAGYAPLGPAILAIPGAAALVAAVNTNLAIAEAYINAIPLKCSRDP